MTSMADAFAVLVIVTGAIGLGALMFFACHKCLAWMHISGRSVAPSPSPESPSHHAGHQQWCLVQQPSGTPALARTLQSSQTD